jgi:hypothetical protein
MAEMHGNREIAVEHEIFRDCDQFIPEPTLCGWHNIKARSEAGGHGCSSIA